jgi:hypothetical protein
VAISWRRHDRDHFVASLALSFVVCSPALAHEKQERTLDEIKVEAIHRAENGMYPLIGLDPADVKEAFASIHTKDKDEWASAFMAVADRYMNEGKSIEKTDPTKANADYIRAWRLYSFGRWPIPASPGKQRSYERAIAAFLAHTRFWDPPLEIVHIPFEGREIIGYLRLPKDSKVPPRSSLRSTVWTAARKIWPRAFQPFSPAESATSPWTVPALGNHRSK